MADILKKIESYKRREIADAKVRVPRTTLEREIAGQSPPRGFIKALERATEEGRFGLVAEIKSALIAALERDSLDSLSELVGADAAAVTAEVWPE